MTREGGEEELLNMESLITAVCDISEAGWVSADDRYCLRPPISEGEGDVEQFIKECE